MSKRMLCLALAFALCALSGCAAADTAVTEEEAALSSAPSETSSAPADTIVVYTPHDADPMNAAIDAFMTAYPEYTVEVVAGGTGELCERIKAEASSPKADVLWGGGADSLEAYADLFEPYVCSSDAYIPASFKDGGGVWTGESPLPMVIIYNKKLLDEAGIAYPTRWEDCLDPALKGKIAYCDPSKSGSAYTQLCTMIQAFGGGDEGWDFVAKFAENLGGNLLDSSGKCHKLVASGEYPVGITIEKSAATYADDPDIGWCYPAEGTSAVPDACAIVKNCPHPDAARIFVDFVMSAECQTEQRDNWNRRPSRTDLTAPAGLPAMEDIKLVDYDFAWAASDKAQNLSKFAALVGK